MDIVIEKEVNFMDEEKIKGIYAARDILCNFCENYDACSNCQITLLVDQANEELDLEE